jgi:two-component system response regulator NreC
MIPSSVLPREITLAPTKGALRPAAVPIEIVLAYHQTVVRSGLRMLLDGVRDFKVVAEASNAQEARPHVRAHNPRVLVLDLDEPGGATVAAIPLIRTEFPGTRIVAMSARQDHAFVRDAIAAGALGYVPNTATAEELMQAVRRAASDQTYLSIELRALATSRRPLTGPSELSPREVEVLGLIAMGNTNSEIAEHLVLSVRTVETHRAHVRQKLERVTRAELVAYAFENGIGSPQ